MFTTEEAAECDAYACDGERVIRVRVQWWPDEPKPKKRKRSKR